jgi:hypothetical protein
MPSVAQIAEPEVAERALASGLLLSVDGHPRPSAAPHRRWPGKPSRRTLTDDGTSVPWRVDILAVRDGCVTRRVWLDGKPWCGDGRWSPELVIWPSWYGMSTEDNSWLHRTEEACQADGQRLRDSAKWMSTVLGATLAVLIGTSPLTDMRRGGAWAMLLGTLGMICLLATLYLVLRVMQPGLIRYEQLQAARRGPLEEWRTRLQDEQDLYLPCGIKCLFTLRQTMIVDELTLTVLQGAVEKSAVSSEDRAVLEKALKGRATHLEQLRVAVGQVLAIAEFYDVQAKTRTATTWGIGFAAAGVLAIALALSLH